MVNQRTNWAIFHSYVTNYQRICVGIHANSNTAMITREKLDARPQRKVLLTQILAVKMYGGPQPLHHVALAEVKVT